MNLCFQKYRVNAESALCCPPTQINIVGYKALAIVQLGTRIVDFDKRQPVLFPVVSLNSDNSYLFFLAVPPASVVAISQNLLLIAVMGSGSAQTETPLLAKFFPKPPLRFMFTVSVPKSIFGNSVPTSILVYPKDYSRSRDGARELEVSLSYETQSQGKPVAVIF